MVVNESNLVNLQDDCGMRKRRHCEQGNATQWWKVHIAQPRELLSHGLWPLESGNGLGQIHGTSVMERVLHSFIHSFTDSFTHSVFTEHLLYAMRNAKG